MEFLLGILIGICAGGVLIAAFLLARGAHRLARRVWQEMRGLHW